MHTSTKSPQLSSLASGQYLRFMEISVQAWFLAAVVGHIIFASYIIALYGGATLTGNPDLWNTLMPHGYVEGNTFSNLTVIVHVFLAFVITVVGPVQLVPFVRNRWPAYHRWAGRIYGLTALLISLSGVFISLRYPPISGWVNSSSTMFNGVLIIWFVVMVWKYAVARRIDVHRKWALRLFLAASGVWFYRLMLTGWLFVNQGPVGFDPVTFKGPALTIMNFLQYLLPLAVLELYFWVQAKRQPKSRMVFSVMMIFFTLLTVIGVFAATMILWWPYM